MGPSDDRIEAAVLLRRRRAHAGNPSVPRDRLPAVNAHVEVAIGGEPPRPSRVEDAADGLFALSRPTDESGYPLAGQAGAAVRVRWTSEWGIHEVAGTIVEASSTPVPLWTVRAEAAPPVHQRREGYRLEVRLPLVLTLDGSSVDATLVDLSEGGLGFEVAGEVPLEAGAGLDATLVLDDDEITLAARIVRLGEPRHSVRCGGMKFENLTEEHATRVRRYVLQEQIRRRALVRD